MSLNKFSLFLPVLLFVPSVHAQQKKPAPKAQAPASDTLGLTCIQILQMRSAGWVAKFQQTNPGAEGAVRAISSYGKCYDARTDRLASALGRSGKGPLTGARGNFQDFDKRLMDFTAKALAADEPPADVVKTAYSNLYEKRFRYEFYEAYEPMIAKPAADSLNSAKVSPPENARPSALPSPSSRASTAGTSSATPGTSSASSAPSTTQPAAAADVPPITKAKNRFGELLALLPDEKARALHTAFGDVFGNNQVSETTRLEVYEYTIYLLEPPSPTPFAPPPF